ncbi:MAG: ABC transporter ATP-binding protein [Lachnospiraceae bacterium]|nr:ABC transporter ATP-binding protein [Lachnospiraceae bacterium]
MSNIVEIDNVSFKYKGSQEGLLRNVSVKITEGETVLLCGVSGSGKTTLIRLINGLIPHYYSGDLDGNIVVDGFDIKKTELYELAGTVGTVFQNPRSQFFSVDTDGEIVFGPENIGLPPSLIKERANEVTTEMKLDELLGRSIFDLSGGEKQKIACASVSALMPKIMLLDEPSSNLDWNAITDIRDSIINWRKQGKTIIVSEHRLWYLRDLVDRIIYLDDGKIVNEWSGSEFYSFTGEKIRELKLRPIQMTANPVDRYRIGKIISSADDPEGNKTIRLKDFYFSYHKRPYLFRKGKLTQKDADILNMNIPDLALPAASVIGVVGHNGTGKSTFLRCVCGLEKDCTGTIEYEGVIYKGRERLKFAYMVMQDVNHQLFTDSVESEVLLSMGKEDKGRCKDILTALGIEEFREKHPMALSGGQKQRVAIASAIASGAKLLLFDEPTSGLDYEHMKKVGELLKGLTAQGSTVLVSTHDQELIEECCDYVLCIEDGKAAYLSEITSNQ